MTKWELARYLIEAKKSVDTVMFLSENVDRVTTINVRAEIEEAKRRFYVNLCVVTDKCFPNDKKEICKDPIIGSIYYERDKNYAHKDENYTRKEYVAISDIADDMKRQLLSVRTLCDEFLPNALTLDYIAFDSKLFRIAYGITKEAEEKAFQIKHPGSNNHASGNDGAVYKVFSDTEDIRKIPDEARKEYATILSMGINLEESLQKIQDGIIRTNVLYGTDIWVSINYEALQKLQRIRALGLLDIMDVPYIPQNKQDEKRLIKLLESEGLLSEQIK